jgi:hypothetical protein
LLVGDQLPTDLRDELGPDELGRALTLVGVAELVERPVLLGLHGVNALASRFLTG